MAGLSDQQIKQLEGMKGIDQTLLGTYKKNKAGSTPKDTVVDAPRGSSNVANMDAAFNVAVHYGREERKDSVLDMVGGMIPAGALPATSFASVLKAFNDSSAPIENTILDGALNAVEDQEKERVKTINAIRDLSLSVAIETGDTVAAKIINGLAKTGDMDAAIEASLAAYGEEYIRTANGIKRKEKNGEEDTLVWEYDAGTQVNTNPGENRSALFVGRDDSLAEIPYVDYSKGTKDEVVKDISKYISYPFAEKVRASLSASEAKEFFQSYVEVTTATGQYQDPEAFLKEYADPRQISLKTPEQKTTDKEGEKTDEENFNSWQEDIWEPKDPND